MRSHQLPPKPHPIASAFFDAFDAHDDKLETAKSDEDVTRSSMVAKIRNSLGWRTRYSSSALYPVSIIPVEGRRISEGEKELASFHVRQVFPRQSNRRKTCSDGDGIHLHYDYDDGGDGDGDGIEKLPISVREDDCEFGTGATVWPGSIVLLKYLEKLAHDPQRDNVLEGKTVADLGSGTAITSIASALLGASAVVCTDGCDPVVDLARRNIHDAMGELSPTSVDKADTILVGEPIRRHYDCRGCKMVAQKYRWGEGMLLEDIHWDDCDDHNLRHNNQHTDDKMQSKAKHFDIILGADCIVPKLYPIQPLVDALDELSGSETVSYLSYEQRHYEKYDPALEFRRLASMRNLEVEVVPDHELHPMYPANDIQIWKVTRNRHISCMNASRAKKGIQMCSIQGSGRSNHKSLLVGKHS